jgi:Rap1a immunity proteins
VVAHFLNAEHTICLPDTTTSKQIRDVAVKFLQEHPELRSNDGYSLVGRALTEAFPCAEGPCGTVIGGSCAKDRPGAPTLGRSAFLESGKRDAEVHHTSDAR